VAARKLRKGKISFGGDNSLEEGESASGGTAEIASPAKLEDHQEIQRR
jgi:hypothetical protein